MNNLKLLRKQKSLSQEELGKIVKVTKMTISRWESGKSDIDSESLRKLSEYFGVSIDQILGNDSTGKTDWQDVIIKPVAKFSSIIFPVPLVATLRCGYNCSGQRVFDVLQEIELPPSYRTRYGEDIVLIKAIGVSMQPTIRPRDLLICKPGDSWEDGAVVAVNIDDSDTIKRIYHAKDGGVDLIPDNPEYRKIHFSPDDLDHTPLHILGRIVRNMGQDL